MLYLHTSSPPVIHRDLKYGLPAASNVLTEPTQNPALPLWSHSHILHSALPQVHAVLVLKLSADALLRRSPNLLVDKHWRVKVICPSLLLPAAAPQCATCWPCMHVDSTALSAHPTALHQPCLCRLAVAKDARRTPHASAPVGTL